MYSWQLFNLMLKRVNFKYTNSNVNLSSFSRRFNTRIKFGGYRKRIDLWFKEQSAQVAKACTRQCEFIVAQRIKRSIQICHLYTKMWDEVALKEIIKLWKTRVIRNSRQFLVGTIGVSVYNWDLERISDEEVNSYSQEIEDIYKLRDCTVICTNCHLRIIIDNASKQPGIEYCKCDGVKTNTNKDPDGWQPYIERQDMLVWRRQEPDTGLFAYKVYGSFPDVTAEDFLQVQIDIDYRKQWDTTAQELQIIDTDPRSTKSNNHSADVIYWEMIWPKLFANRDYVYQRRWVIDKDKRVVVIVSKGTDHPNAPVKPGTHRVRTYWSYMVIKPYKDFHQPGIEFGLTYFDDPGMRVPSAITAWVAIAGLSDFLTRMRQASKDYKKYKTKQNNVTSNNHNVMGQDNLPEYDDLHKDMNRTEKDKNFREYEIVKEDNSKHGEVIQHTKPLEVMQSMNEKTDIEENNVEENEDKDNVANPMSQDKGGLLNYFFLSRLFA
ncbi:stAR-related lipid transfer protein 7, mitochondrial-like isoform X1 [Vespa crabro]|uniref:stAR-related lipid transfer protein 7, mitochondrial-like isoform X1 n=1 Tax=Vespa crabro TaxID=7445 RepID=UPI001F000182|nr:stAR-related lipid transfer protein 7, mitochondrial-like isoform X1 [Vespa crabro]